MGKPLSALIIHKIKNNLIIASIDRVSNKKEILFFFQIKGKFTQLNAHHI